MRSCILIIVALLLVLGFLFVIWGKSEKYGPVKSIVVDMPITHCEKGCAFENEMLCQGKYDSNTCTKMLEVCKSKCRNTYIAPY
jgi:hypothetical protein